jgi:predicted RNase H-like HicB family nuclease
MKVNVVLERLSRNGYRVRAESLFPFTAEGQTPDEALRRFKEKVQEHLSNGAQLITLDVPVDKPWLEAFGVFRDDPDFDEWQEDIAAYRRQIEEDPNAR